MDGESFEAVGSKVEPSKQKNKHFLHSIDQSPVSIAKIVSGGRAGLTHSHPLHGASGTNFVCVGCKKNGAAIKDEDHVPTVYYYACSICSFTACAACTPNEVI